MARTMTGDRLSALVEVSLGQVVRDFDDNGRAAWRMTDGSDANGRGLGWLSRFGYLEVIEVDGDVHPAVLSEKGQQAMGGNMVSVAEMMEAESA